MMTLTNSFHCKNERDYQPVPHRQETLESGDLKKTTFFPAERRILLIDSNVKLIERCRLLLGQLGFSVDVAKNTSEAIKKSLGQYAVILVRDNLPKINAFLILRFIRTFIPKKSLPRILAICKPKDCSIENLAYHFVFGANDFIKLPITLSALQEKLNFSNITIQRGL